MGTAARSLQDVDSPTSLFLHELCQSLPGLPSVTIPTSKCLPSATMPACSVTIASRPFASVHLSGKE